MTNKALKSTSKARPLGWLDGSQHRPLEVCPGCSLSVSSSVGITKLVYTFEVCACSFAEYEHLVEQLWHRDCFVECDGVDPHSSAQ